MKDLGWANGWKGGKNDMVDKCREARKNGEEHDTYSCNAGNCVTLYGCRTCSYFYKIDSSG